MGPFVESWLKAVPGSLKAIAHLVSDTQARDIDLRYGLLTTGILWPVRKPLEDIDLEAIAALRDIDGLDYKLLLKTIQPWNDDILGAARTVAEQAKGNSQLRTALDKLITYFDEHLKVVDTFGQLLTKEVEPRIAKPKSDRKTDVGQQIDISGVIRGALVNIGGGTQTVGTLIVQLGASPRVTPIERFVKYLPVLLIPVVALVIGIVLFLLTPRVPPPENFPFNVAIAGFTVEPASGVSDSDAQILSNAFYNNFKTQVDSIKSGLPISVGVWSPAQVGLIRGTTPVGRETAAQKLVADFKNNQNLHADVVVYGVITKQTDLGTGEPEIAVLPEFYIAATNPELADVLGRFSMQTALSAPSPELLTALSGALSDNSRILSSITLGLVLTVVKPPQYDNAFNAFTDALKTGDESAQGKELVRVLMANARVGKYNQISAVGGTDTEVRGLSTLLTDIQTQFATARKLKTDFSRAYIGLAGAKYLQIVDQVAAREAWNEIKEDNLKAIEALYQQAMAVPDRPPSADIPTKFAFGMGQVQLLRYWRGEQGAWDKAKGYFDQVIADYGDGKNTRVKEFAAQATGYLGLLYSQKLEYGQAQTAYKTAISLTNLDTRKQVFNRAILQMNFDQNRADGKIADAVKAVDAMLALKMPARDKAIVLFHEGVMLSENNRDQDALNVYTRGVALLDDGVSSPGNSLDPVLAAHFWALIGDKQDTLSHKVTAIQAYQRALLLDPKTYSNLTRVIADMSGSTTPTLTPTATLIETSAATSSVTLSTLETSPATLSRLETPAATDEGHG